MIRAEAMIAKQREESKSETARISVNGQSDGKSSESGLGALGEGEESRSSSASSQLVRQEQVDSEIERNQLYDEQWDREVSRRLKIQAANQFYIQKRLSETLNQMMIATLNNMPEEPSQFMKDYINLHYFFEQGSRESLNKQKAEAEDEDDESNQSAAVSREGLRKKDLEELRNEHALIKEEFRKFQEFKNAFATFTQKMNDLQTNGSGDVPRRLLSEQSLAAASSQTRSRQLQQQSSSAQDASQQSAKTRQKPRVDRIDSEFGVDQNEEQKEVIVSPKSSLISSRVAEPEQADHWTQKMIEFATQNAEFVQMAKEKHALARKKALGSGPRNQSVNQIDSSNQLANILKARQEKGIDRRQTVSDGDNNDSKKLRHYTAQLQNTQWLNSLNEFMDNLSEFLVATASQNNFGSISSQIIVSLASSIPVMTDMEDFASAEEKARNQQQKTSQINEKKLQQEALLSNIELVHLKKDQKLYSLSDTLNIVVSGEVLNLATGKHLKRFDIFSDCPIQVNLLDHSKPLNILSELQRENTKLDLESRGIETSNALRLVVTDPNTYVICLNFQNASQCKLPLNAACVTVRFLFQKLQAATQPKPGSQRISPWTQRITFLAEEVLRKEQTVDLDKDRIYFVNVGKVALGKRIVEEQEFIYGKRGRRIVALRTTSLITMVFIQQRS